MLVLMVSHRPGRGEELGQAAKRRDRHPGAQERVVQGWPRWQHGRGDRGAPCAAGVTNPCGGNHLFGLQLEPRSREAFELGWGAADGPSLGTVCLLYVFVIMQCHVQFSFL